MSRQQSQVKSKRKLWDPVFHLQTKEEENQQLTRGMIKVVRRTGQLNLSSRKLATVPDRMFSMYDSEYDEAEARSYDFNKMPDEPWWNITPLVNLDLSSNVLNELPGKIEMFEDLAVLNLQDNNLTTLPKEIGKLKKLTKLNLNHNKINKLPKEFYKLSELSYLSLSHNCLENISKDVSDLIMLEFLDLSYNNLEQLPSGVGFLVRLTELNFAYNKLAEIPPDIVNLRVLSKLDLTHNNLKRLPDMGELRKLQFLYVQHNDIEELPNFEGCEKIEQLYFGNNYLKEVTTEFCENMPHLKMLDLRDNQIKKLADEMGMMQQLIRLDLTNNELEELPCSLGMLPHLQNLLVEGNKLKQIRSDVLKGGTIRILKFLRERFDAMENQDINLVSEKCTVELNSVFDKYKVRNSKVLNLTMKELTNIPEEIFIEAQNAEVTSVDLCKNKFTSVPEGLKLTTSTITELNLSHNQLKVLPEFLGECEKLKYFNLGNNHLNSLPVTLSNLLALRELVISNNKFTLIPQCVYDMEGLEILQARDNSITAIDVDGLKKLKRIAVLDLSNNNIDHCPPELGNITQLKSLELKGNGLRQPRYAILERGTESILSYLRDRIPK